MPWAGHNKGFITQHNVTDVASFEVVCNKHAQDHCLHPDALDWRVRQCALIAANMPHIKLHILEWPSVVTSPRHTCVLIIPFNEHPDMPHLSGG